MHPPSSKNHTPGVLHQLSVYLTAPLVPLLQQVLGTPEATLAGVGLRRQLSGQHASTPAPPSEPYHCVALGDPIMDVIAFERGDLLSELGFEKGGCAAVEHYDDILRLQRMVDLQVRPWRACMIPVMQR